MSHIAHVPYCPILPTFVIPNLHVRGATEQIRLSWFRKQNNWVILLSGPTTSGGQMKKALVMPSGLSCIFPMRWNRHTVHVSRTVEFRPTSLSKKVFNEDWVVHYDVWQWNKIMKCCVLKMDQIKQRFFLGICISSTWTQNTQIRKKRRSGDVTTQDWGK